MPRQDQADEHRQARRIKRALRELADEEIQRLRSENDRLRAELRKRDVERVLANMTERAETA